MIIRSSADLCCYRVIEIQLLEGALLLTQPQSSSDNFIKWEHKVRWVSHALVHTLPLVLCRVLYEEDWRRVCSLTRFFPGCSICMEIFGVFVIFSPNNSRFTLLLETKLIKDEMASLIHNLMAMTIYDDITTCFIQVDKNKIQRKKAHLEKKN